MPQFIEKLIKRVAIIGGGPGGIAAARALKKEGSFEITIFERNEHNGGTWAYSNKKNPSPPIPSTQATQVDRTLQTQPLFSPMYDSLRTNLTHAVMGFPDVPFPDDTPTFPTHRDVFRYLTQLVQSEEIERLTRYGTIVDRIEQTRSGWSVSSQEGTDLFDAVVIATGHYSVPYIPDIPGLVESQKVIEIVHSRDYRVPDEFKDKVVLVIGGGSSGSDMTREVCKVAKKVYQSIRTPTELSRQAMEMYPVKVEQVQIEKIEGGWVESKEGERFMVDVILFGTGYLYSFPFLKEKVIESGQKVYGLDHYMFYRANPTLCFIGLPIRVVPMPLMQRQSVVMARYWAGKIPYLEYPLASKEVEGDDRTEFIMGVAREVEYNERLGAWAEGWLEPDLEGWNSNDPLTGRIPSEWLEPRKNSLILRKEYLGY